MILDARTMFSEKQALTASASSQKVLDLGSRNGADAVEILVIFTKDATPSTGTLTIEIRSADALDGNGKLASPKVLNTSGPIPAAQLKAGLRIPTCLRLPPEAGRYVDLNYVLSTPLTQGEITAGLTLTRQTA